MTTVSNTIENNIKVKALKKMNECYWTGTVVHANLETCLTAINLLTLNSGWYKPVAIKISGVNGYFMLNQDGSIMCENRVIKQDDGNFRIEYLSNKGWDEFEKEYIRLMDSI